MRLNRKWLYLGGLIAMLTLLLTLTWVLPVGAVGILDEGDLSADKDFVSPDRLGSDDQSEKDRTVKVTLTNGDLDSTMSVRHNGDFDAVEVTFGGTADSPAVSVLTNGRLLIDIQNAESNPDTGVTVTRPTETGETAPVTADKILPIIGEVTIDDETTPKVRAKLGAPVVVNRTQGVVEIPVIADLYGDDKILLSYNTSNQETALVNVRGDRGDMDLLLVESPAKPGEYSGTFVVKDLSAVKMTTAEAVVDEQHRIDSGLEGYKEFRNESVTQFFQVYEPNTGTLSGPEDFSTPILGSGGDAAAEARRTFYARVSNPPLRSGRDGDGDVDNPTASTNDVTVEVTANITATMHNANQGILQFVYSDGATGAEFEGFAGGDVEVDYFGSDTFSFTVNNGPIRLGTTLDTQNTQPDVEYPAATTVRIGLDILGTADDNNNIKISLPTTEADKGIDSAGIRASANFAIVSVENDINCKQCKVTLGVITGGQGENLSDGDPDPLDPRFSVLAISYFGSERVDIPDDFNNIDVNGAETDTATGSTNGSADQDYRLFRWTLDAPPYDSDTDKPGIQHDIKVVAVSRTDIDYTATTVLSDATIDISIAVDTDENQRISGREVWFRIDPDALDMDDDDEATTNDGATDDAYFDVVYTREVGALPMNAFNLARAQQDVDARPVIAVAPGSRVRIESGNDAITIDAEKDGPSFANASPVHEAGTGSPTQTLSIDITDDLAGVNSESIKFTVTVENRSPITVVNRDLDIVEIEGGYRASVALDDVRNNGRGATLRVDGSKTTEINWSASASDMAGNSERSDADPKVVDGKRPKDNYIFSVDGVSPTMERAYTGDWFDVGEGADGRVEGDRRVSRDNYLPGMSNNTSIRVVFDEALDEGSVSADDFTVDGATPGAALVYVKGETKGTREADATNGDSDRSVFLTVPAMSADATPEVAIVGSISDKAGNVTTSGSKTATDGIAPSPTVSVDTMLSQKTVNVTVTTNERIRTQYPALRFYVSDALDKTHDSDLDEKGTFTVGPEDPEEDVDSGNPLVLRDDAGEIVFSNSLTTAGNLPLTLSEAPILDKSGGKRDGKVDGGDLIVEVMPKAIGGVEPIVTKMPIVDEKTVDAIVDAKAGKIMLRIGGPKDAVTTDPPSPAVPALKDGDKIVVTYRGTDPDPANQFTTVPSSPVGTRVSGENTWTYKLNFSRNDRFAVVAVAEDVNRNQGVGGMGDPSNSNAVVFEIDSNLAGLGVEDAMSEPADDASGTSPVAFEDPFTIDLSWPAEKSEYPGDSNASVTLTKLELDGVDVIASAAKQDANSYSIDIEEIGLGAHTLAYNAQDSAGNEYPKDRTLKFTVKERPTWDLQLRKGMNLISLPSNPKDGNVDAVFGDSSEVNLIFTFEGGQAQVAVRNPGTAEFAGTLKMIDSRHAYWVSASNASTVEIEIPGTSQQTVLPSIQVKGGEWNLLPVLSLGRIDSDEAGSGAAPGTKIDADSYFGDFQIAFGWDRGNWNRISPDPTTGDAAVDRLKNDIAEDAEDADPVLVGRGYWVLYTEDAFIVPR